MMNFANQDDCRLHVIDTSVDVSERREDSEPRAAKAVAHLPCQEYQVVERLLLHKFKNFGGQRLRVDKQLHELTVGQVHLLKFHYKLNNDLNFRL